MNLREAAERTSRSITTLRRYIRSGRLPAEKRRGRYGPEYFVSDGDLAAAGLEAPPEEPSREAGRDGDHALVRSAAGFPAVAPAEAVPLGLFQELQLKHEQLLVQYGMVRSAGMRVLELRAELDATRAELARSRERLKSETERQSRRLREAELELEGRRLEIAALREKVRGLEMLTRNSVTSETIERQFSRVMGQAERVRRMWTDEARKPAEEPDH